MKKIIGIVLVILLSYFSIKPLFIKGYFPMHDDTQVARVIEMGKALRQRQFPVRWVSDLGYGYGYPLFNFYGPLPYYVGGTLYALGIDAVVSTKAMFGVGIVLAAIFLFIFLYTAVGFLGAIGGSMVYLYAPYHAVQAYIRGAVGEYWATAFLPLLFLGFWYVLHEKKYRSGILWGSFGLAGVITSHTLLGFLSLLFIGLGFIIYICVSLVRRKYVVYDILSSVGILLGGLGLSAFFWLPAFYEMPITSVSSMILLSPTNFYDHFVCLSQLWNAPWGYGGSAPGCVDGMSFKIGKIHIILLVVSSLLFFKKRTQKITSVFIIGIIGLLLTLISVVGMLSISKQIWAYIPYAQYIQYPWRLLSFTMLGIAILSILCISVWKMRITRIISFIFLVSVVIFINAKNFQPQYVYFRDTNAYESEPELKYIVSKISDEYMPQTFVRPQIISDIATSTINTQPDMSISDGMITDTYKRVSVTTNTSKSIPLNIAYFPGWKFFVNGVEVSPVYTHSIPSVTVQTGKSIIEAKLTNTPIRLIGNIISVCFLFIFVGGVYGKKTNA